MLFDIEHHFFNKFLNSKSDKTEWASVRATVLRSLAEVLQYSRSSISNESIKTKLSWKVLWASYYSLLSILRYTLSSERKHKVIFFSDVNNASGPTDENFLFKEVISNSSNTQILIVSTFNQRTPNRENIEYLNIYLIRYFYYFIRVLGKIKSKFTVLPLSRKLILFLEKYNLENTHFSKLNEKIIISFYQTTFLKFFLSKILKIDFKNLKMFVFEDGFMSRYSKFIKYLNSKGIETIEYQHGAIYSGHEAYNTHPKLISKIKLEKMIPSKFWLLGKNWINYSNLCDQSFIIGVPWYQEVRKKFSHHKTSSRILIISDGIDLSEYEDLSKNLVRSFKNSSNFNLKSLSIQLRLHPSEKKFQKSKNVLYSDIKNIWEDLRSSDIVIACVSTCLYQASFINKKPIIWLNGRAKFAYNAKYPFKTAENLSDLKELIDEYYSYEVVKDSRNDSFFSPYGLNKILK